MTVHAGQLDELLAVEKATETRDAHGGVVESWAPISTRWANVEALAGRELERARMIEGTVTHRVTIRAFSDLTRAHRFANTDGSRPLGIVAVLSQSPRAMTQTVLCKRMDEGI